MFDPSCIRRLILPTVPDLEALKFKLTSGSFCIIHELLHKYSWCSLPSLVGSVNLITLNSIKAKFFLLPCNVWYCMTVIMSYMFCVFVSGYTPTHSSLVMNFCSAGLSNSYEGGGNCTIGDTAAVWMVSLCPSLWMNFAITVINVADCVVIQLWQPVVSLQNECSIC